MDWKNPYRVGKMKITPLLHRDPIKQAQFEATLEEIKAIRYEKRPASTVQAASLAPIWDSEKNTLREMTDEQIEAYRNRPWPTKDQWQRETDAEKIQAELIAANPTRITDLRIADDERRKSKNTIGQSDLSAFSPERRELARQAFSYTPPAELTPLQKERLVELNPITPYTGPVPEAPKRPGLFQRLREMFQDRDDHHVTWRDAVKAEQAKRDKNGGE